MSTETFPQIECQTQGIFLGVTKPSSAMTGTSTVDYSRQRFYQLAGQAYRYGVEPYAVPTDSINELSQSLLDALNRFWAPQQTATYKVLDCIENLLLHYDREVPEDVMDFCCREGIMEYLQSALDLVSEHFPDAYTEVGLQSDYDSDDQWVTLNVRVRSSIEDILHRYDSYINDWVAAVPWPAVDQIRLSYDIA